jgi:hypothetical protein
VRKDKIRIALRTYLILQSRSFAVAILLIQEAECVMKHRVVTLHLTSCRQCLRTMDRFFNDPARLATPSGSRVIKCDFENRVRLAR